MHNSILELTKYNYLRIKSLVVLYINCRINQTIAEDIESACYKHATHPL